jgi:hypothetical protein
VVQNGQDAAGAAIAVDSAGKVVSAGFAEANFAEADSVTIRPAEEVIDDFINGRLIPLGQQSIPIYAGWEKDVTIYHPPLPEHTIGEQVTILDTDNTHFLVAEDGSEVRATLATIIGGKYELVTPDLAHIADTIGYDKLRVTGTIEAQLAPDTWRLVVESWETIRQQDFAVTYPSGCAAGPVTIDESGAWITAESTISDVVKNGRYQLENLPVAIQNGDRIEACGEPIPAVDETLIWSVIYAPPRDLTSHTTLTDNAFIIEAVQLVYFYDLDDPALALASPAWVVTGSGKVNASRFVAFLDATQ